MRTARKDIHDPGKPHTLLLSNQLHPYTPTLSLDGREVLRQILFELTHAMDCRLLAWCLMPDTFRLLIHFPSDSGTPDSGQNKTSVRLMKKFQMRINSWIQYSSKTSPEKFWRDRYRSSLMSNTGEKLSAAVSIDAFPMMTGYTDHPSGYYFTSYHHACTGCKTTRANIASLLGMENTPWHRVNKRYSALLTTRFNQPPE